MRCLFILYSNCKCTVLGENGKESQTKIEREAEQRTEKGSIKVLTKPLTKPKKV